MKLGPAEIVCDVPCAAFFMHLTSGLAWVRFYERHCIGLRRTYPTRSSPSFFTTPCGLVLREIWYLSGSWRTLSSRRGTGIVAVCLRSAKSSYDPCLIDTDLLTSSDLPLLWSATVTLRWEAVYRFLQLPGQEAQYGIEILANGTTVYLEGKGWHPDLEDM